MFADLTEQTMFGVQEGGQGDRGRYVLGLVLLLEASRKLAVIKPDEQEEIQPKAPRS